jgi:hypothetical protein
MCPRSAEKIGRRARNLRTIAKSVSVIGSPSAITGTSKETRVDSFCRPDRRALAPSAYPRNMLPVSPRKMVAGLKL